MQREFLFCGFFFFQDHSRYPKVLALENIDVCSHSLLLLEKLLAQLSEAMETNGGRQGEENT